MNRRIILLIATFLLLGSVLFAQVGYAPADFDGNFGFKGVTLIPGFNALFFEVAPNGEIVIANVNGGAVSVLDPSGNLIRSIPRINIVIAGRTTPFLPLSLTFVKNQMLLAGYSPNANGQGMRDLTLVMLKPDLTLNTRFGNGGFVVKPGKDNYLVGGIILQPDSSIVVAGRKVPSIQSPAGEQFLCRFFSNGSIDNSFGLNGEVSEQIGANAPSVLSLALQNDTILVGGTSDPSGAYVVAYDKNGNRQPAFNSGNVLFGFGQTIAVQPDLKIVGQYTPYGSSIAAGIISPIGRLLPDGSPDTTFSSSSIPIQSTSFALTKSIQIDQFGRILVADNGSDPILQISTPIVRRYDTNGLLDRTFVTTTQQNVPAGVNYLTYDFDRVFSTTSTQLASARLQGNQLVILSSSSNPASSIFTRLNN